MVYFAFHSVYSACAVLNVLLLSLFRLTLVILILTASSKALGRLYKEEQICLQKEHLVTSDDNLDTVFFPTVVNFRNVLAEMFLSENLFESAIEYNYWRNNKKKMHCKL